MPKMFSDQYLRQFRDWRGQMPTPTFVGGRRPVGAHDEASPAERKPPGKLMAILATKLSEEDYLDACRLLRKHLRGETSEAAEDDGEVARMDDPRAASTALDEPPPFEGRPRTGGAMDEALLKDIARVRVDRSASAAATASMRGVKIDKEFLATLEKLS